VDGFVIFTVVVRAVLFCFGKCRIVPDWSRASDPWLVLGSVEDLVDGEPERNEVLYWLEGLERSW